MEERHGSFNSSSIAVIDKVELLFLKNIEAKD